MRSTLSANIWFQWEDVNVWANGTVVDLIIKAKRIWRLQSFYPVEFGRKSAFFHVIFPFTRFLEKISTGVIVTFSMEWLYLMKWSYKKFLYLRLELFRILTEWLRKRPFRLCDVSPTYWAPQPLASHVITYVKFELFQSTSLSIWSPVGTRGFKSRMCPPYPHACRKRRLKWGAII